jgi:hypothetical protein
MMFLKHATFYCFAALAFICVIPGIARSEISYKIPTGFGWRSGLPLHLLEVEAVQKDLGLSAEASHLLSQWKATVSEAARTESVAIKDKVKLRKILQREQTKFQSELNLILTPKLQERLHEIDLQFEGLEALSDGAVATALELSSAQISAIRAIHERMLKEEIKSVKGGGKADYLSMRDRDKLLLDVLKPEQQVEFARMKGSDFDSSGFLPYLRLKDRELEIWNVAFSPDGKRLASSRQNDIFIWDVDNGKLISQMNGHRGNITSLCFGPDGKWLISASTDRSLKSWDVESGENIQTLGESPSSHERRFIPGLGTDCYRSIALKHDGKELAHANGNSSSISYSVSALTPPLVGSGEIFSVLKDKLPVWSVAFNADGMRYACGRIDGSVYLMGVGMSTKIDAATDTVLSVAYSADGQQLATASADGMVKLWSANDGRAIANLTPHEKAARCVAFNHDASLVVSAGEDGIVRITSQQNSSATIELAAHQGKATAASFHPTDNRLATTGSDGLVRIWSDSGRELFVLNPPTN